MNILFVCSRNKWRSRTAETIFKNNAFHQVKSAGTAASARIKLTEQLLSWADLIFVMENKHKERIQNEFPTLSSEKKLHVLDIPDEYEYMDEELVEILESSLASYFRSK